MSTLQREITTSTRRWGAVAKRFALVAMIAPPGLTAGAAPAHGEPPVAEPRQSENQAAEDARQARQRRQRLEALMERREHYEEMQAATSDD